ncbi:MAG: signal peptidase I [Candidatus Hatepunaea meridiana]|nr:signal peptidase I [Candidatus Hatepunaea meridiana]
MTDKGSKPFVIGNSMSPTFRQLDKLIIESCHISNLCVGDVIVFSLSGQSQRIVHRVTRTYSDKVRTQGDNTNCPDPYVVTDNELHGRVSSAMRGSKYIHVKGGISGHTVATVRHIWRSIIRKTLYRPARLLYKTIERNGLWCKLLPLHRFTQVLIFSKTNDIELRLQIANSSIGRLCCGSDEWQIRAPFSMFIDVSQLPDRNEVLNEMEHKPS